MFSKSISILLLFQDSAISEKLTLYQRGFEQQKIFIAVLTAIIIFLVVLIVLSQFKIKKLKAENTTLKH